MALQLLFSWWNLIYLVPLGFALIYLIVYMATGIGGEVDADHDHDVSADHDHDVAAGDHDTEHDAAHAHHAGASMHVLSMLGVGKAPLSVLVIVFLMVWSIVGMIVNRMVWGATESVLPTLLASVPAALIAAFFTTAGVGRLFWKYLPNLETYAKDKRSLVGMTGEAQYDMAGGFGTVQVRDEHGDLHQLSCRTREGDTRIIRAGQKVVVFEYDSDKSVFYVAPVEVVGNKEAGDSESTTPAAEKRRMLSE